ncbi:hypothetical protein DICPUDRAFT_27952 [Dictyostelium purpureum]|uniref:COPI associated protein n=1 Tax=Dictyostelium purpureum TaxID=5786 RepID=F0ZB61_DICPU|nr:uncharacterized protein DICPUDRAFT_27952 [Dictyostelium purpureum]EGC38865.1 hypothetical protein DICPUDRAFT_27952 [Dictyostelium purpureum]|eukprot:XP_003284659.1 hypothetical protein DICPUDRAFT_27952 [Dictyostelium purpureum]
MERIQNIITMSAAMTVVHFSLGILLFISSIILYTHSVAHYNNFLLSIISLWIFFTGAYGWKYYTQYYFMYTYFGRGVFYFFVGILVWGSSNIEFYSMVIALLFLLFGLGSMGLGLFSKYDPPRPVFGPYDFVPHGQKENMALASQADFMDDSPTSSQNTTFTI